MPLCISTRLAGTYPLAHACLAEGLTVTEEPEGTARLTLPAHSPCTAGKSCSARDLNQLSVCLPVGCFMTTTVGEAYLVRTIG